MIAAFCPRHATTVLYSPSSIVALRNTPLGVEVVIECYDGELIEVLMGATTPEPALQAAS